MHISVCTTICKSDLGCVCWAMDFQRTGFLSGGEGYLKTECCRSDVHILMGKAQLSELSSRTEHGAYDRRRDIDCEDLMDLPRMSPSYRKRIDSPTSWYLRVSRFYVSVFVI